VTIYQNSVRNLQCRSKNFALPNFKGAVPPKVVPALSPLCSSTSRGKVS